MFKVNGELVRHLAWLAVLIVGVLLFVWNIGHAINHHSAELDMAMHRKAAANCTWRTHCKGKPQNTYISCDKAYADATMNPYAVATDLTVTHMLSHWNVFRYMPAIPWGDFTVHKYLLARTLDAWVGWWFPLAFVCLLGFWIYMKQRAYPQFAGMMNHHAPVMLMGSGGGGDPRVWRIAAPAHDHAE